MGNLNQDKLHAFLGMAVADLGAAASATLMLLGDRLGLYKALAQGAATSAELAQRTGTNERYVREWLGNQAAGGYVQYDAASDSYSLNEEQRLCLADPDSPVDLPARISSSRRCITRWNERKIISGQAKAWNGASIMPACSMAPNVSSAPATTRI